MMLPKRGEVWLVDLGLAAKVRPCLVLNIPPQEDERALCTLVVHTTTSSRNTRFEVEGHAKFLRSGVFDAQNIITIPQAKLIRKLGALSASDLQVVEKTVCLWLGL
jgi:mRNA interferase MazF